MVDHMILTSAKQAWPPFVLVTGLLLIGAVAAAEGLFEALGARLARARLSARSLLLVHSLVQSAQRVISPMLSRR